MKKNDINSRLTNIEDKLDQIANSELSMRCKRVEPEAPTETETSTEPETSET